MPDASRGTFLLYPRSRRPTEAGAPAEWQVLAYLAADNDLEGELLQDLLEMERVGSLPGVVEVLAQVDRARGQGSGQGHWYGTRRYHVTRSTDPRRICSRLLADLGPTNTGDPGVLESFIRFGAQRYPARATALILLNHGSGFYVPPEMQSRVPRARRRCRPLFSTTAEALGTRPPARGIAYDEGAADCLDNQELKRVLATAHRLLGRKVDVVGMDACLMTMLEVAYQLREHARVLVGSEELEPGAGWPYAAILGDLTATPTMAPAELGSTIVRRYLEGYRGQQESATQSAIDLEQLGDLVDAVDDLARALLAELRSERLANAVHLAWLQALHFFDHHYVDVYDWTRLLHALTESGRVRRTCGRVMAVIDGKAGRSPILAEAHSGPGVERARGLSIYFPAAHDPSHQYRELDFAQRTAWGEFLETYLGARPTSAPDTPSRHSQGDMP